MSVMGGNRTFTLAAQSGAMKAAFPLGSLAIGMILGLAVAIPAWFLVGSPPPRPSGDLTPASPRNFERSTLATHLMARIAPRFVATARPSEAMANGVVFYDQPRPYGEGLCRVRSYAFAPRVVEGRPGKEDHSPTENLTVTDLYALWAEPGTPDAHFGDRDRACAHFQDFDHLISGDDGIVVERAVTVLARVIRAVEAGRPQFHVACLDRRADQPVPCDGLTLLRAMKVRDVFQVMAIGSDYRWDDLVPQEGAHGATYWDRLQLRAPTNGHGCGASEALTIRLETRQTFGRHPISDGDPKSVMLWRDVIC